MPKRGNKSRGGRGGSRGGSFRNYNLSKSSRRRNNRKHNAGSNHRDIPELMDLEASSYTPEVGVSMKSLSRRPNRKMMEEARYTSQHASETLSQPMRYRKIEFVRATEVYDPSRDLIKTLQENASKQELWKDMEQLKVNAQADQNSAQHTVEPSQDEDEEVEGTLAKAEVAASRLVVSDKLQESSPAVSSTVQIEKDKAEVKESPSPSSITSEGTGPPLADEKNTEDINTEDIEQSVVALEEQRVCSSDSECHTSEDYGDGFEIDESGNEEILSKHNIPKMPTSVLLAKEIQRRKLSEACAHSSLNNTPEAPANVIEHEPYIKVGNVLLQTSRSKTGITSAKLPRNTFPSHNFLDGTEAHLHNYVGKLEDSEEEALFESHKAEMTGPYQSNSDDEDFDELGMEDYFNNIMGNDSSDESIADFQDSEDEFDESMIKNPGYEASIYGSEAEIDAALDAALVAEYKAKFDDFDYTNVQLSQSNTSGSDADENLDYQYLNSDEEQLQGMLEFARKQQNRNGNLDVPVTQTTKTKGKGKKQRLELNSELEVELRESLMEQFQYQKKSKRDKKLRKKAKLQQEGLELNDLKTKYDYSLHIQEIKQEFETFLHDAERETMSFPPLDGHGNKTINKLANHYNMKCIKCGGNGLHMFMKVTKSKKTFRYVPAYDQIGYVMRQRPVFRRVDVKPRTKEEIAKTDGKKGTREIRNNANVREGDIVGGQAPEIGDGNIGRQLLEKLGWVKGEGLGAHGNKGISVPLTATVKRSKTGLK